MDRALSTTLATVSGEVNITGSKSESNRLLILQALYPEIEIENLSNSDDSVVLQKALNSQEEVIDVHHAGTAMRFLTAYFASQEGREVTLTGSSRMQERPIRLLVEGLQQLGADIKYEREEGYPPLRIKGKKLLGHQVQLKANVSSQYISALMLIAPSLPNGIEIQLKGKVTSTPYLNMTLSLMHEVGFSGSFEGKEIKIAPQSELTPVRLRVESDWSSASYFYSIVALSEEAEIGISCFKDESYQGDAVLANLYKELGVQTSFEKDRILLSRNTAKKPRSVKFHLSDSPDIAQTIAVTCLGLGIKCEMTGLHTLKIKETDRLQALKNEIERLGGQVAITTESIKIFPGAGLNADVKIETYNDHRMAMAFAPLALKVPLQIADAEVVSKSYPSFWEDLERLGFQV